MLRHENPPAHSHATLESMALLQAGFTPRAGGGAGRAQPPHGRPQIQHLPELNSFSHPCTSSCSHVKQPVVPGPGSVGQALVVRSARAQQELSLLLGRLTPSLRMHIVLTASVCEGEELRPLPRAQAVKCAVVKLHIQACSRRPEIVLPLAEEIARFACGNADNARKPLTLWTSFCVTLSPSWPLQLLMA